ncbi:hypothetical protein RRG08_049055 [Elysia crispata]|uniref:Uncharacterized protein n=1 Tax=Elysia crispata TaxID=231223 RepID=A0AAE1A9R4_9GAST|nr:hypothetical protein RRG08_049055 [Elysia crispata]
MASLDEGLTRMVAQVTPFITAVAGFQPSSGAGWGTSEFGLATRGIIRILGERGVRGRRKESGTPNDNSPDPRHLLVVVALTRSHWQTKPAPSSLVLSQLPDGVTQLMTIVLCHD